MTQRWMNRTTLNRRPTSETSHFGITMEQAHAHFHAFKVEERPDPVSAFCQGQEDQCYNLDFLTQHQLAKEQNYTEFASEAIMAAMSALNPNFIE